MNKQVKFYIITAAYTRSNTGRRDVNFQKLSILDIAVDEEFKSIIDNGNGLVEAPIFGDRWSEYAIKLSKYNPKTREAEVVVTKNGAVVKRFGINSNGYTVPYNEEDKNFRFTYMQDNLAIFCGICEVDQDKDYKGMGEEVLKHAKIDNATMQDLDEEPELN